MSGSNFSSDIGSGFHKILFLPPVVKLKKTALSFVLRFRLEILAKAGK